MIFPVKSAIAGLFGMVVSSSVLAAGLEEIVVTAQARGGEYSEIPAVTIVRPADFLVQGVQIINDSRSPELRRQEILATIEGLLKRASSVKNIALSYGEGFLSPVDLTDESLAIIDDRKRADTSVVALYVKITLAAGDDTKKRIVDLRAFIKKASPVGRTEIEPQGDVGLSIVNPERYRGDILARIAEENDKLVKALGTNCHVTIDGLEGRVRWERTAVAELTLYIPYGVEISDCSYVAR